MIGTDYGKRHVAAHIADPLLVLSACHHEETTTRVTQGVFDIREFGPIQYHPMPHVVCLMLFTLRLVCEFRAEGDRGAAGAPRGSLVGDHHCSSFAQICAILLIWTESRMFSSYDWCVIAL